MPGKKRRKKTDAETGQTSFVCERKLRWHVKQTFPRWGASSGQGEKYIKRVDEKELRPG